MLFPLMHLQFQRHQQLPGSDVDIYHHLRANGHVVLRRQIRGLRGQSRVQCGRGAGTPSSFTFLPASLTLPSPVLPNGGNPNDGRMCVCVQAYANKSKPRNNFDTFSWSFLTVFQVLCVCVCVCVCVCAGNAACVCVCGGGASLSPFGFLQGWRVSRTRTLPSATLTPNPNCANPTVQVVSGENWNDVLYEIMNINPVGGAMFMVSFVHTACLFINPPALSPPCRLSCTCFATGAA